MAIPREEIAGIKPSTRSDGSSSRSLRVPTTGEGAGFAAQIDLSVVERALQSLKEQYAVFEPAPGAFQRF